MSTPVGMVVSGRYRLDARIGHGGMSTVYKGFDEVLERAIAVKVMDRAVASDADQLERFRREARAVAQLNHPHIVTVIDAGEDDQMAYIVFEYVEGPTLRERLADGALPPLDVAKMAKELGAALTQAHEAGVIHRDVKPENVILSKTGAKLTEEQRARLLDVAGKCPIQRIMEGMPVIRTEEAT